MWRRNLFTLSVHSFLVLVIVVVKKGRGTDGDAFWRVQTLSDKISGEALEVFFFFLVAYC